MVVLIVREQMFKWKNVIVESVVQVGFNYKSLFLVASFSNSGNKCASKTQYKKTALIYDYKVRQTIEQVENRFLSHAEQWHSQVLIN